MPHHVPGTHALRRRPPLLSTPNPHLLLVFFLERLCARAPYGKKNNNPDLSGVIYLLIEDPLASLCRLSVQDGRATLNLYRAVPTLAWPGFAWLPALSVTWLPHADLASP